jgi:Major tropism determinant N-terminal domain
MAVQIQLRRGTATQWANTQTGNPILAVGEMALETDTNLFKIGDGYRHWNDLPYGGIQGPRGNTGTVGPAGPTIAVQNVLYVSKSGNDNNDGTTLGSSKLTIKAALAIATRGTTIFVKSGDYLEANPMVVPDFVSVVGDNLRLVTVRPQNVTQDLFYVNNGVYIAHMTFKEHVAPAAAIAFPADGSAGVISTSPYVQNCTSMTTTGTGMRVDGDLALGTKSMVVDAFTQYNQGGVGIHMLNGGYTQLVSVFTICCDKGFLCETGGSCSITNSNSSFGNYALYADGVGAVSAQGKVVGDSIGKVFTITNLTSVPGVGDAIGFGNGNYYTVASAGPLTIGNISVTPPNLSLESADLRNARQNILSELSTLQVATIEFVKKTYPGFDFNQFKCSRDVGTILNSICYDMVLNSNYQTILAGNSYYRGASSTVTTEQFAETLAAINFLKTKTLALVSYPGTAWTRVNTLFNILIDRFTNGGTSSPPAYQFNPPTGASTATVNAVAILQANKLFLEEETTAYISNFTYNTTSCYRDTGLIVDSIAFDMLYGGFSQGTFAGLQYWSQDQGFTGDIANEIVTLTNAIGFVKDQAVSLINGISSTATSIVTSLFTTITNILNFGPTGITNLIVPDSYESSDTNIVSAYNTLINNISNIADSTIQYLNTTTFTYNTATCYRDTGLIVDSIALDLLYNSISESTFAGLQYWSQGSYTGLISTEIEQTKGAINHLLSQLTPLINTIDSSGSSADIVSSNFAVILDILNNGVAGVTDKIVSNGTASTDSTVISVYDSLITTTSTFAQETVNWVISNYPDLVFNTSTCYRDVTYIIQSVAFDLLHGGNKQSIKSGVYYYGYDSAKDVIPYEKTQVRGAYAYIRDTLLEPIITGTPLSSPYSTATQVIAGYTPASISSPVLANLQNKINLINTIINEGPGSAGPKIPMGLIESTDPDKINAYKLLIANREFVQKELIAFINYTYHPFYYDKAICRRDVGYILQSVAFDLLHGGNRQSIMSGVYYYSYDRDSTVVINEIPQTVAAYKFVNELTKNLVLGNVTSPTYQRNILPVLNTGTATTVQTRLIDNIVSTITNIISNGPSVAKAKTPIPLVASTVTQTHLAFKILLDNRSFIQAETVGYITNKFKVRTYNTATCLRDTGLIVDSIALDLAYGGTSQSTFAGLQYWSQNQGYVENVAGEVTTVTNAINHVKGLTAALISSNITATTFVNDRFDQIVNIISNGTAGITDTIIPNGSISTNTGIVSAYNTLITNQASIANQTVTWINSNNPGFVYNQVTCYRDITYMVQSVAFDLLHGGNRQSIMSGVYYYRYNSTATVIANEIPQTVAAYNFIKDISQKIVLGTKIAYPWQTAVAQTTSTNTATQAEVTLINTIVSTITNIISNGPTVAGPKVPIGQTFTSTQSTVNAYDLLVRNRAFIQQETIAYINNTFGNLTYSTSTCKRDIGYVLDAISYDLMYGGNSQTNVAADAYYDGDVLQISSTERPASAAAYYFLASLLPKIITNTSITPNQNAVSQNVSLPVATSTEGATARYLMRIVAQVVDEAYSSVITLIESVPIDIGNNTSVTFQQFSKIQSSSHSFEYIGAGTNIDAALPYLGGVPITENQAVAVNGGKVYFTGTDQKGNFQIGNELTINNNLGTISGRTFTKSLFAVMTPYILAIGA